VCGVVRCGAVNGTKCRVVQRRQAVQREGKAVGAGNSMRRCVVQACVVCMYKRAQERAVVKKDVREENQQCATKCRYERKNWGSAGCTVGRGIESAQKVWVVCMQ